MSKTQRGRDRAPRAVFEPAMAGLSPAFVDKKTEQLCKQVEEAVSLALLSSTSPTLRDLVVLGVEPHRGVAQLRVLVCADDSQNTDEVLDALDRARGYLRAEVSRAIHRKRTPLLRLVLTPGVSEIP